MNRCFIEQQRHRLDNMIFDSSSQFDRDLKRLSKKFRSLYDDIELLKMYSIELFHAGIAIPHIIPIEGCCNEKIVCYKVRAIACKSLKNKGKNTGLRLTYVFAKDEQKVTLVEIYYKGEKDNEERSRFNKFLSG